MTAPETETSHYETHWEYFKELLQTIRKLIHERYKLTNVSIRPIGSNASRLSIPVKIVGVNDKGEKVVYFGKILGSSDLITARSIQLFKNVYLQLNSQDPIFGAQKSAEEMAREQYEMLRAILDAGVPTARPYGYHPINGQLWLVVAEFLDAKPISASSTVNTVQMDSVFRYLKKMHRKGIFHGDIKPDNIMFGDKIYLLDVGRFREGVPSAKKLAYDLACMICSFLECQPAENIVRMARKYYSGRQLRAAAKYLDLVQRRPDINFTDETKNELLRLLNR
jgi:tRNA A-37 threonylcarbamoyl transferase component Bud32